MHGTTRYSSRRRAPSRLPVSNLSAGCPTRRPVFFIHCLGCTEAEAVRGILAAVEPDEVYNLGAQSHVGRSFEISSETLEVNARGALSVLEAARQLADERPVRVYQASSSEMFGAPHDCPQNEQTPFRPCNPYASSKVYAFHQAVSFREAYQLFVCNGILYNHESPATGQLSLTCHCDSRHGPNRGRN